MVDEKIYQSYVRILREELLPAMGCTEPIAVALAAAKAREVLGCRPEKAEVCCSGNVIKNVMGVKVPNSGGQKGVAIAAALGIAGGNPAKELEVLSVITDAHREEARKMLEQGVVRCSLKEGVDNLYVAVTLVGEQHTAQTVIAHGHTHFVHMEKDGQVLLDEDVDGIGTEAQNPKDLLTVEGILTFARTAGLEDVIPILDRQIEANTAISDYGLNNPCGSQVGAVLLSGYGNDTRTRAKARAAAGSDARMSGCTMPVVINSGSGNQGLTVSMPVIEYAEALQVDRETLYRALIISNLVAIHQKSYIGNLSAFCGAVCAACGAGAAIAYLHGDNDEVISGTIINTLANVGGMVCDGAKASCAAKIAAAVDAAILGHSLAQKGLSFEPGDGIVQKDVETTMKSVGHMGKVGMKATDIEILHIMLGKVAFSGSHEKARFPGPVG